jgi:hypothetical protein
VPISRLRLPACRPDVTGCSKPNTHCGAPRRYTRTLEIREVSVPVARAEDLKRFYRLIENDERVSAVLKRTSP